MSKTLKDEKKARKEGGEGKPYLPPRKAPKGGRKALRRLLEEDGG